MYEAGIFDIYFNHHYSRIHYSPVLLEQKSSSIIYQTSARFEENNPFSPKKISAGNVLIFLVNSDL